MQQFFVVDQDDNIHSLICPPNADIWAADDLIAYAADKISGGVKLLLITHSVTRIVKGYHSPAKVHILPKETGR